MATTPSIGAKWALENQGGLGTYYTNIRNMATAGTLTPAAMEQYGITQTDISAAQAANQTVVTPTPVTPAVVTSAPVAGVGGLGSYGGVSIPLTAKNFEEMNWYQNGREELKKQILAQGTSEKYWSTGSGLSKEDAAGHMAEKLYNAGITKLTDFAQRDATQSYPVVTGRMEAKPPIQDEYGNAYYPPGQVFIEGAGKAGYFVTQSTQVEAGDGYSTVESQVFVPLTPEQQASVKNGQFVLPTGQKEYYNKSTGQAIPMEYDRAKANDWGGTFAGDSSTGFGVQFQADGTPIFYTHYDTEDQLGGFGTIISVLAIIPSPLQPFAMAANAVIAAEKGDIIGAIAGAAGAGGFADVAAAANFANAVKNEDLVGMVTAGANLSGVSTSNITQSIGESLGATSLIASKALGSAVLAGAGAAVRGEDAITAAITGGITGAFSGMKETDILKTAVSADIAGGLVTGDIVTDEYGTFGNYDEFMAEVTKRGLVGDPNVIAEMADAAGGLSLEYGTAFAYDTFINQAIADGLVGVAPETKADEVGVVQNIDYTDFTNTLSSYDTTNTLKTDSSGENYSLEGRNYLTEDSTQGTGGSSINSTMTNLEATSTTTKDDTLTVKQITDVGKVVIGGLIGGAVVNATQQTQPSTVMQPPSGDIYKDAPISGFKMVKMENIDGAIKYIPFIGDKAQLPTTGYTRSL